jgi:hypothetical protein
MLQDITGIVYGGFSSRFWMLRKHVNSIDMKTIKDSDMPFFSWQCLTLNMKHRDVDVVIQNEQEMEDFITLIIWSMKSVNNSRDSAKSIYKQLRRQRMNSLTTDECGLTNESGTERSSQHPNKRFKLEQSEKHAIL